MGGCHLFCTMFGRMEKGWQRDSRCVQSLCEDARRQRGMCTQGAAAAGVCVSVATADAPAALLSLICENPGARLQEGDGPAGHAAPQPRGLICRGLEVGAGAAGAVGRLPRHVLHLLPHQAHPRQQPPGIQGSKMFKRGRMIRTPKVVPLSVRCGMFSSSVRLPAGASAAWLL